MIALRRVWPLFFSIFLALACDDAPAHEVDAGEETAAAPSDDSGQDEPDAEEQDASQGDQPLEDAEVEDAEDVEDAEVLDDAEAEPVKNDSFETARPIEIGDTGALMDEKSADQVDYFVFSGEAGSFYELTTNRGTFSPDNLISLYDSEHELLAENDDGWIWPGDKIDSRLVVRLPATGQYFVRVEDRFTPPEFFAPSELGGIASLLYYVLHVRAIGPDSEGYAFADQANASITLRKDEASGYAYVTLLGQFDGDIDLIGFSGIPDDLLVGHMHPGGPSGSGSTAAGGRVRVLAGERVLAEIDRAKGQEHIHPPLSEGSHQLSISPEGSLGDNPFYAVDLVLLPDNPREQADAMNGTLAGAEAINFTGRGRRRGLMLSTLGAGDVDYYSFDALAGQQIALGCEGESAGSGVRGLHVELRDTADVALASADETATSTLQLPVVQVAQAGTYYIRLASAPQTPASIEPWTRCSITVN